MSTDWHARFATWASGFRRGGQPPQRPLRRRVFLSHNGADKHFVRLLASDIESFGVEIWLDDLDLGASLSEKISEAIETSTWVAVCLSPRSILSAWVQREMEMGISSRHLGVTVIPLLLAGLADERIPSALVDRAYGDFRGPEKYDPTFRKLLRILESRPGRPPERNILSAIGASPLPIDDRRLARLMEVAGQEEMRSWVIQYLAQSVSVHGDPTERYWIYVGLGLLGASEVKSVIRKGLEDSSPWARQGASEAAKRLGIL